MSIFKATKKPVTIEAIKIDCADDVHRALEWMNTFDVPASARVSDIEVYIDTLEGRMTASEGDYIIKGVQGEFYPCKPGIFRETYSYRCKCGEDVSFKSIGCIYCKN